MAKYVYPAVFTPEKEGGYSINFPDLPGCYTCGDDLYDGLYMANDVLSLVLMDMEEDKSDIPAPSNIKDVTVTGGEFVTIIPCDTVAYRKLLKELGIRQKENPIS